MKTLKLLLTCTVICLAQLRLSAQPDTTRIIQKALFFADSLVKADAYETWPVYADLVIPSVIKYYGGKDGYIDYIQKARVHRTSTEVEEPPVLKPLHLLTENEEWQAVIEESGYIHRDGKKVHIITYLVGQSRDGGETWRLFDVGYNRVAAIIYMMPDVFGDLPIPEHIIRTEDEELAMAQAAQAAQAAAAKNAGKKKTAHN
jgi:hypothetical protein